MQNKFSSNAPEDQAKGMRLTQSRLELDNALNRHSATVKTDKSNDKGDPAGTAVKLAFDEEQA